MNNNLDNKDEILEEMMELEQDILILENKIMRLFKKKLLKQNALLKLKKLMRGIR